MDYRATIVLYLELLLALAMLWREGLLNTRPRQIVAIGMVSLAFVLRYCCLTYETLDYQDWLVTWLNALREAGPWKGLGQEIWSCNYNVPYIYFLALIAKSGVRDLLLIKLFSILFDVILAWTVMRLVGLLTKDHVRRLIAFVGVLWLPTVYLNGALWGQCDVIYSTFAVLGLYLALSGKPGWSVAAVAVSVSFKLQGIFLLPMYLVLLIAGKIKFRHLFIFPAVYVATLLPAVFAGRNFWELLTLYYNNTSSIGEGLNYNSSSMYALFDFSKLTPSAASSIGIMLALFLCAGVFIAALVRYKSLSDRALLGIAVLFCVGVPFFLPHMHDRYFFMADVLTFALAVTVPALSAAAVCVSFGSFLGYYAYLKMRFLVSMRWGAAAMVVALLLTTGFVIFSLTDAKRVLTNREDLV